MPDTYFTISMSIFLIRVGACCRDSCPWFFNSLIQSITIAFHTFLLFIMLVAAWSKNGCKHHQIFTNKKWENRLLLLVLQHLRQGHWGHWLLLQSSPPVISSFASPAIQLPCLLAVNECVHEPTIDLFKTQSSSQFKSLRCEGISCWCHFIDSSDPEKVGSFLNLKGMSINFQLDSIGVFNDAGIHTQRR